MSDDTDKDKAEENKEDDGKFHLHITLDSGGNVQIEGGINNLIVAYGALELAKDALRRYHEQKNAPRIMPPPTGPAPGSPFGRKM